MKKLRFSEAEKDCSRLGTISLDHSYRGSKDPDIRTPEIAVLNVHGGSNEFELPRSFRNLTRHVRNSMERYVLLERDTGAREIAEAILRKVSHCLLITIHPPRGIIDLNRVTKSGIPLTYHRRFSDEKRVLDELMNIHSDTLKLLERLLRQIHPAFMVDIHTMASYSPIIYPRPPRLTDGDSIERYLNEWNTEGEKRPVQIFTTFEKENSVRPIHCNSDLFAVFLFQELLTYGHTSSTKKPYSLRGGIHMSQEYVEWAQTASLTIDVPKNIVTRHNGSSRLEDLIANRSQADMIADCIVRARINMMSYMNQNS